MAEEGTSSGAGGAGSNEPAEHLEGTERRTALIDGATFAAKPVQYSVVDGLAIFEGDIVLGTVEEVEQQTAIRRQALSGQVARGVVITGANRRWPNCQVPFEIDGGLTDQARVTDAIAHWEANTRYRFIARTAANAATFPDFVTFRPGSGCSAAVGRRGGQQFVNVGPGCSRGNIIHEIGHVIGLWHEQSREDRDAFVTINWAKIAAGMEHNFNQHISDGDDVGAYDYGSIMHYPRTAFSVDGSDTITPVDSSAAIGQRTALSAGDIAAANSLCPATIKEIPKDPIVDTFKEPPRDQTIKEVSKDPIADTVKESVVDTVKEVTGDPKGPLDPGPGTLAEHIGLQGGGGGPAPGPFTGGIPFAVATGHQAPALGGAGDPAAGGGGPGGGDPSAQIQAIDAQLQGLAEALGQLGAQQSALQDQYDQLAAALAAALRSLGQGA